MNKHDAGMRDFSPRRLMFTTVAFVLVFVWAGVNAYHSFRSTEEATRTVNRLENLRTTIIYLDEVLTMSARMAAATGDPKWEERYRYFEPKLNTAINNAVTLVPEASSRESASKTDVANKQLIEFENQAFDLVRKGKKEEAFDLLSSQPYDLFKKIYSQGMVELDRLLTEQIASTVEAKEKEFLFTLAIIIFAIPLIFLNWLNARKLFDGWNAYQFKVKNESDKHTKEISKLRAGFDHAVRSRTEDIEKSRTAALNILEDAESARIQMLEVNKKLTESEALFRAMSESSPLGVFLTDLNGDFTYTNRICLSIVGFSSDEIMGKGWTNALHPGDRQRVLAEWLEAIHNRKIFQSDQRFSRKDGTRIWAHIKLAPVKSNGTTTGFVGTIEDISARIEAESALRESEQYDRDLFDKSPIGLALCQMDGKLVDVNPAFAKIVGRTMEECLQVSYWDLTPQEYIDDERKQMGSLQLTGRFGPYEKEFIRKNKSRVPVRSSGLIIEKKHVPYILSSAEDITDRKKAEHDLLKAQTQLIEAEKSATIAKLAAGAAHEVKNPLAILLQGIHYLKLQSISKDERVRSVIADMSLAVQRADSIIKGLLDVSAFSSLTLKDENPNTLLEGSLTCVKNNIERHHVKVVKRFEQKIPQLPVDKDKMTQVFINLFTNAVDAMEKGGTLTVTTQVEKIRNGTQAGGGHLKEAVVIKIEDTGTGIPEDVVHQVFEPFYSTKRGKGGTGLGLSVTRSIVQLHHGTVSVENRKDKKGACATVFLPIQNA